MEKNINLLIVSDCFNYNCGVSKHIYYLLHELPENVNAYLLIPGGTAIELLNSIHVNCFIESSLNYKRRSVLKLIKAIMSIYRIVRKYKIDIIHSHNYYAANAAGVVGKLSNIKTIQTIHSYYIRNGILKKYSADYYIMVSEYLAEKAKEEGEYHEERMKVINNGIIIKGDQNETAEDIKSEKNNNDKLELLVASRLIVQKGIQIVIEAISLLPDADKEKINLKIAGTGDYQSALEQLALEKNVKAAFLGEVVEMGKLLLLNDIFIFSSYEEGFGLTLLEAASHNCFIISSNYEGGVNLFRPDIDGFIYEKHSAQQLAEAISKAIKLGDQRNKYITSFKYSINKRFTAERMTRNTYNYYIEISKRTKSK
jgi:glycosyltransferase involved in cell wall biosynthesis